MARKKQAAFKRSQAAHRRLRDKWGPIPGRKGDILWLYHRTVYSTQEERKSVLPRGQREILYNKAVKRVDTGAFD